MVDWNDPELQEKLGILSTQLLYAILGLYGWEYVRSSHVEITLLRRQLSFRWPLLPYITGRFSFLLATILLAIQFSPFRTSADCQIMNTFVMFATNVAIGCSTTNLMIRTWMIWKTSYVLRFLLILLSLGHWTILTLFVATARASTRRGVCMIYYVNHSYATASVMYGMLYDLLLLAFTVVGLWRMPSSSALWKTLVKQGMMYLIINLLANTVLLVLNRLNLNRNALPLDSKLLLIYEFAAIMNAIFGSPAACICTIASSQAVRSLLRPSPDDDSTTSPSTDKDLTITGDFSLPVFTAHSGA